MSEVRFVIHSKFEDGEAVRDLARRMTAFVRENEPGTTTYTSFQSADDHMINEDSYATTDAFLTHLSNIGEQGFLDEFLSLLTIASVRVLGSVDDAAREALSAFGAVHYEIVEQL